MPSAPVTHFGCLVGRFGDTFGQLGVAGRAKVIEIVKGLAVANAEPWGKFEMEETKIGRLDHKIGKLLLTKNVPGTEWLQPYAMSGDGGAAWAGEGGQQLAEGALKQLARQDPLQRAGSLDGHIQIGFHHLLPGDPHEGEHGSQLLTPLFIGINDQHPHSHHIYLPYTPDAKLLFFKCL